MSKNIARQMAEESNPTTFQGYFKKVILGIENRLRKIERLVAGRTSSTIIEEMPILDDVNMIMSVNISVTADVLTVSPEQSNKAYFYTDSGWASAVFETMTADVSGAAHDAQYSVFMTSDIDGDGCIIQSVAWTNITTPGPAAVTIVDGISLLATDTTWRYIGRYYLQTDGTAVVVSPGVPGGVDTSVQYNDGGSFGGDANFKWDKTNQTLTMIGDGVHTNLLGIAAYGLTGSGGDAAVGSNANGGEGGFVGGIGDGSGTGGVGGFVGGAGGTTGNGGHGIIMGGEGGATSGDGGPAIIRGGDSQTSGDGGDVTITVGAGAGAGADGTITLTGETTVVGSVSANYFSLSLVYAPTASEPVGSLVWNTDDEIMDLVLNDGVTEQVGLELYINVINQTGSTLLENRAIGFAGALGASGQLLGKYYLADGEPATYFIGVSTHNITNGEMGKVTIFGKVRNVDTTGATFSESWSDGEIIYVSGATAGYLSKTRPARPAKGIQAAAVVKAHANGTLMVRPTWFPDLGDINDVAITSAVAGDILAHNGTVWENIPFSHGYMPKVGTPVLDTLADDFTTRGSSGVSDGTLTYVTVGTTAVKISVAAGEGYIRTSNDQQAALVFIEWPASADLYTFSAPAAGQENTIFIGIEYNAGTPQAVAKAAFSDWNWYDNFPLARCSYDGTTMRILNAYAHAEDTANLTRKWMRLNFPFHRETPPEGSGGLELSSALRALAMTGGRLWHGFNNYIIDAVASGSAFDTHYKRSGGGFNMTTGVTAWPNTQYDDASGTLQDLTTNRYGTLWVYLDVADGSLDVMYGAVNAVSVATAQADTAPTIPAHLTYHGVLIGRIIFQKSAASATLVESAWTETFSASAVGDHSLLSNLLGGSPYYHLPASGSANQILKNSGTAGAGAWGTVTENAGALDAVTTINMSGQLTNTVADGTGTPPFVVASTTKVVNLNADLLDDRTTATAATSTTIAARDANGSLTANNFLAGFTTIATAGGTTVLTVGSTKIIQFTGSTTQTVTMPVVSTLVLGQQYLIINDSSGIVAVNSSGGNGIFALPGGTSIWLTCDLITGTTAASWTYFKPQTAVTADLAEELSSVGDIGADTTTWPLLSPAASSTAYTPATSSSLTYNAVTGAMTTNSFIANTTFLPDANDGAALGTTASQFSDLFLAEGGVINFDNGDVTITQVGNTLAIAGGSTIVDSVELGHASDTTLARSAAGEVTVEGRKVVLGISFRANKNGTDQTGIVTVTPQKVTFTNQVTDIGGYYDAANSRFTPLVAGEYEFNLVVTFAAMADQVAYGAIISLNGADYMYGYFRASGTGAHSASVCSGTMTLNGSTDYVEAWCFQESGSNQTLSGSTLFTYFSGKKVG